MTTTLIINQQLALFIPHVRPAQANAEYIADIFHRLNIGYVKHVEFQPILHGAGFKAFVFMNYWYSNSMVERLQERILGDEDGARLVYDDPHAWTLYPTQRSEYLAEINHLKVINHNLVERVSAMDVTIGEMQWWIKMHDASISYLCDKVRDKQERSEVQLEDNSFHNNSCCGAVSEGWYPTGRPL